MTIKKYIKQYNPSFKIGNTKFVLFLYGEDGSEDINELVNFSESISKYSFLERLNMAIDEFCILYSNGSLYDELEKYYTVGCCIASLLYSRIYVGEEGLSNIYKNGKFVDEIYFEVRMD